MKMKKNDTVLKKTISKKTYESLLNGGVDEIELEITSYWCKRIKGLTVACPYSLPFTDKNNKLCQKYGTPCLSGKTLRYYTAELKQSKSEKVLICDIETMQFVFNDDKLMLKIKLSNIIEK